MRIFYTAPVFVFLFCANTIISNAQPALFIAYDTDSLGNEVNDYLEISSSEYWVATNEGLGHYTNYGKTFAYYYNTIQKGLTDISCVKAINGNIWVGAKNGGVASFDGTNWAIHNLNGDVLAMDNYMGTLIVLTKNSLYQFVNNSFSPIPGGGGLSSVSVYNNTIYASETNMSLQPVKYYDGTIWHYLHPINTSNSFPKKAVQVIVTPDSTIWCSHQLGFSYLKNDTTWDTYTTSGGLRKMLNINNTVISIDGQNIITLTKTKSDTIISPVFNRSYSFSPTTLVSNQGKDIVGYDGLRLFKTRLSWINGNYYEECTNNKIKAGVSPAGDLFANVSTIHGFESGLEMDNKVAIFASNLWLLGETSSGDTMLSGQQYRQSGSDQYSGPISNSYDSTYLNKYDHVWRVSKSEIENHQQNFNSNGYQMPFGIARWPGNGDISKGEAKFLAPFKDYNFNGIYEPGLGEHPDIRGDEAVYFIYNDVRGRKTESSGKPFEIEVHGMMYVYDTISSPAINNTLFLSYKIINRSSKSYQNLTGGFWTDFDLGNPNDDLVGSDSINQITYAYNGDIFDEGPLGYGNYPPALAHVALSDPMSGFMYYNNTMNASSGNPREVTHYANLLKSKWLNGFPLVIEDPNGPGSISNGDGFTPTGMGIPTKWAYNDTVNWYESPANKNDKRALPNVNLGSLSSGDEKCLDFAIVYARDSGSADLLASVDLMKTYTSQVKQFYSAQSLGCLGAAMSQIENDVMNLTYFPNPISTGKYLTINTATSIKSALMYSIVGQQIKIDLIKNDNNLQLQIPFNCKPGVYTVQLITSQNELHSLKLIVNK